MLATDAVRGADRPARFSSANTPNTHSCTRRSGSRHTKRSRDSTPRANSRMASDRFLASERCRSRVNCSARVYSGPWMILRYSRPRHFTAGCVRSRRPFCAKLRGLTTMPSPPDSVSDSDYAVASASLAASERSTFRHGVARRNCGSNWQSRLSVSMCQAWSLSTCTWSSDASRWKGAGRRSSRDFTGQQHRRYAST